MWLEQREPRGEALELRSDWWEKVKSHRALQDEVRNVNSLQCMGEPVPEVINDGNRAERFQKSL